ncbi:major facilitator superfamily-like protein [Aureococcus anophagefferens]|nr:major facilitator superfamily-like protein [Aureococcus anophagefferens]
MTCSNLWLPVFADRHGRRAAFLVSLVGSTVGYAGQACARTFAEMLFFRGIQGLFGGVPPVALAWVTDVFPPNERPRYLAGVQATIASAFVAGAVLGGTLSSFGLRAPMCFACAVSLLGLATAHHYLKDPADLVFEDEQKFLDGKAREDERARTRCNVAYGGASVLLPLFVLTSYGDLPREAAGQVSGLLFGALGLAQAAVMAGGFAPVSARLGLMPTCAIAAGAGAGVGGIPLVGNRCASPWALLAPLALVALGNGLSRPAYVTYLSKIASKKYVSQTMAIVDVTLNAAMVCGPQLTVVFEKDGAGPAFLVAAAAAACELGVAVCVREILDGAFPYLAPGGTESPAHMRDVGRLMASLGHDDWAKDVQDKFQFEPMRRRPKTRFSHDIQGRESSRGALC